jgi:hypothetical protein
MSGQSLGQRTLDLNGSVGDWLTNKIDVSDVQRVHLELSVSSGTWATAVIELLKSSGGVDYYSFSPPITFSGADRVIDIDVHDARYLQLEIDTAEGGAGVALIVAYGDGYDAYQSEAVATVSGAQAIRIDEYSATVTYVGKAATGSAEGSAVWQIQRLTESSGDLTVEWADGNDSFDNVWTNRASLSYS